jgi:hypothetical protein
MLPMTYPVALAASDPAFAAVSGFLTAYLTSAGGVDRYVTADSLISGLGDAYSVALTSLTAIDARPRSRPTANRCRCWPAWMRSHHHSPPPSWCIR